MTFEDFKEIYKDASLEKKFRLYHETEETVAFCTREIESAKWRRNQEDETHYRSELEHQHKRGEWLFNEIASGIKKLEEEIERYRKEYMDGKDE